MTKIIASFRPIVVGLVLVNASPMEWHTPQDDLINRPLLHCYAGRNICTERMSWLAPVRIARHAGTAGA